MEQKFLFALLRFAFLLFPSTSFCLILFGTLLILFPEQVLQILLITAGIVFFCIGVWLLFSFLRFLVAFFRSRKKDSGFSA